MDPFIGGALIGAGSSLLGGLFGQSSAAADRRFNAQQIKEQNEYNNPTNIRKRAEDAGFNPLSFIGPGVGLQTGVAQANSANYMGAAIADAGMAIADGMARKAELGKLDKLQQANAKLAAKVQSLTLRPKVAGVYAQRETTPTIAAAVGGGNGQASGTVSSGSGVGAGLTFGPSTPLLSDQTVEAKPTESITGFMHFRNRLAPDGFYVPGSDGDVMDIWQIPTVVGSYAVHKAIEAHNAPNPRPLPYINPGVMPRSPTARVIGGGNISASANPSKSAKERAAIKAVDPSYNDGSSPTWHKYRQKAWWQ